MEQTTSTETQHAQHAQHAQHTPHIAHLSDVHLLESRPGWSGAGYAFQLRFVSFGRRLDADERRERLLRNLVAARKMDAKHVVISGDLTEMGTDVQFESLGEVLDASGIDPDRFVLVPGNHDAYSDGEAFRRALAGPLARWKAGAATTPGKIVDRGDVCFLPLDVSVHQAVTRSGGVLDGASAAALEARLADPALRRKATIVVAHHPPYGEGPKVWQWIDAMRGGERIMSLLERFENVHVLHGHLHRATTRTIVGTRSNVFGAPAVVEGPVDQTRVRTYELRSGVLESTGIWAA